MKRSRKGIKGIRSDRGEVSNSGSGSIPSGIAAVLLGESAFEKVLGETVALYHRLKIVAERIHRQGELTSGKGGVLAGLYHFGPQTVPQMARARPVSRQYIQTLVNELADEGLVGSISNPAHKRSHLVRLTERGEATVEEMIKRQKKIVSRLRLDIPEEDLLSAAGLLREVRGLFESKRWRKILETVG